MTENQEDYKPMLKEVSDEYRGIRYYVGDLRFWVLIWVIAGTLLSMITNGVTIYLYYYSARPMAREAWRDIRATQKRQDYREKMLEIREKNVIKKERELADTVNYK